ncbi:MAG: hypothetical protein ACP5MG_12755 [Verrucomicrobiia bacterium]|jgi:hypothetical protein
MNNRTKNNNEKLTIPTRFGPEVSFFLTPSITVSFRGMVDTELERLKNRLLREALERAEPEFYSLLRRAANEALALAYTTPYPILFFPLLFEEKVAEARKFYSKQRKIKEKTRLMAIETV